MSQDGCVANGLIEVGHSDTATFLQRGHLGQYLAFEVGGQCAETKHPRAALPVGTLSYMLDYRAVIDYRPRIGRH